MSASRSFIKIEDGELIIEGKTTEELVKEFGTPLYVFSANTIRENCRQIMRAFQSHLVNTLVCYAYKANFFPKICETIATSGLGAEVSSGFELWIASKFLKGDRTVFNGPAKSMEELRTAAEKGLLLINADSISELERIVEIVSQSENQSGIGIRINPEIDLPLGKISSKFGVPSEDVITICKHFLKRGDFRLRAIHFHLGFQITKPEYYLKAIEKSFGILEKLGRNNIHIEFLDIGGGFAEASLLKAMGISISNIAETICRKIEEKMGETGVEINGLILEPGRYIVANSGVILTEVRVIKQIRKITWAIIDAGLNLYHPLTKANFEYIVAKKVPERTRRVYSIGGALCMGADIFKKNVNLPEIEEGSILAILNAGAYTFSLSNQFIYPRPSALVIDNGRVEVTRKKENYEDLV